MTAHELVKLWRGMVDEHEGGVPRYTVTPGAALNTLVTWTDAFLSQEQPREPAQPNKRAGRNS